VNWDLPWHAAGYGKMLVSHVLSKKRSEGAFRELGDQILLVAQWTADIFDSANGFIKAIIKVAQ